MARVDFYLLPVPGDAARHTFACRLAEKAWRLRHTVHLQAVDGKHARELDDLLWTFRDGSFVPHEVVSAAEQSVDVPVTIGCTRDDLRPGDLLINLADELPESAESFPRIAEIVTSDSDCKEKSRKRYAAYRSRGYSLQTHKL